MRKIDLQLVTSEGKTVPQHVVDDFVSGYKEMEDNGVISDATMQTLNDHGPHLDYRKVMTEIVMKASNPQVGLGFEEMEKIRPLYTKLREAEIQGYVLLEEAEYKLLLEKIKLPHFTAYTEAFYQLIQNVAEAKETPVAAVAS